MNANELADYLDNNVEAMIMSEQTHIDQAATMLRQQQAEIEALKQIIDANNLNQNIGQFVKPTNEPVAYRYEDKSNPLVFYFTTRKDKTENPDAIEIPLYTHPVKEQDESFDRTASHMAGEYVSYAVKELTLTDAEISDFTHRMVLCCGVHPNSADINVLGLKFIVEEILRKAQDERK